MNKCSIYEKDILIKMLMETHLIEDSFCVDYLCILCEYRYENDFKQISKYEIAFKFLFEYLKLWMMKS